MSKIINGKNFADLIVKNVTRAAADLQSSSDIKTCLAVVIVGDDAASHTYVKAKSRMAETCGFVSIQHNLAVATTQSELTELVVSLNIDPKIHGILVQLPLPVHLNSDAIIQLINSEKDVDGLGVTNAGKLAVGDLETGHLSCTPAGAMVLVKSVRGQDLSGLNAVVVGRSNLFGKPMAQLLLNANATVTMAHSRSSDLSLITRGADILVVAVGRPEMVKSTWIKPGATIIDVGINRVELQGGLPGKTKLVGDVAFDECSIIADAITPVPGGVGPMTIAMLMANTVTAAYRFSGLKRPSFN